METSPSGKTPNFYPIAHLPMFSEMLEEQLEHDLSQLETLKQVEDRPQVLDDATVARITKLYTEAEDLVWCYQKQLQRWRMEKPTDKQSQEITRLDQQVEQLEQCRVDILALSDRFKDHTIEQIMSKTDLGLALDMLSGKLKPPF